MTPHHSPCIHTICRAYSGGLFLNQSITNVSSSTWNQSADSGWRVIPLWWWAKDKKNEEGKLKGNASRRSLLRLKYYKMPLDKSSARWDCDSVETGIIVIALAEMCTCSGPSPQLLMNHGRMLQEQHRPLSLSFCFDSGHNWDDHWSVQCKWTDSTKLHLGPAILSGWDERLSYSAARPKAEHLLLLIFGCILVHKLLGWS